MYTFLGAVALTVAALAQFNILNYGEHEVAVKLFLLAFAAIMFIKADIKDLRKAVYGETKHRHTDNN